MSSHSASLIQNHNHPLLVDTLTILECHLERSPVIRPFASIGGCQLIKMARGRPSRLITVKSLGAELGAVDKA